MILDINFPDDLTVEMLLEQRKIPCLCTVGKNFELSFESPLPVAKGVVSDWDRGKLEERAPAGGGGEYTYYQPALVTLSSLSEGQYQIIDLDFFCEGAGWCTILEGGEYGPPGSFWDDDIDE